MVTKEKMNRDQMAAIMAQHLEPGWVVNLGFGMPAWVSNYIYPEMDITLHAEHGLLGYGPVAGAEVEDPDVFNASGDYVTLLPGAVVMNHAESFAMIRAGIIDCVILGAYQVDKTGTFANWKISLDLPTGLGNVIGGAMDLAQCSKRVFVMMDHTTNSGEPRLVEKVSLPPTALDAVKLVVTDLGVFGVTPDGFELQQHAPGYTVEEIQAVTAAPLKVSPDLRPAL
jgi:3-oxoacid CoA-transferase B subunit